MTTERCPFCGRTVHQSELFGTQDAWECCCVRCRDGYCKPDVAHAKAVRLAWHYRKYSRTLSALNEIYVTRIHVGLKIRQRLKRVARHYRTITRRRCENCRWVNIPDPSANDDYGRVWCYRHNSTAGCFKIIDDAQCPRFEKREENMK